MLRAPLLAIALLCVLAPAADAAIAYRAETPPPGALYHDGPSGRYLLDGTWLFRYDNGVGDKQRFQRQTATDGWNVVQVPNAWNAADQSEASMKGTIAWYRKDFRLPSSSAKLDWVIRFESVNYRAKVWLNGRPIGHHTGAYLPWEVRLPGLLRSGVNHLVVRVNNRRFPTDFPPSAFSPLGVPTGGWWNYGGLLREVYLRKIDRIDFNSVQIRPNLPCAACAATVDYKVVVRNYSPTAQKVRLTGRYGARKVNLGTRNVGPSAVRHVHEGAADRPSAAVVAGLALPLRRLADRARRQGQEGQGGRGLRAAQRHPLDQGLTGRAADPQRPVRQLPRRRDARGRPDARLRDHQRDPPPVRPRRSATSARRSSAPTTRCTPTSRSSRIATGSCSGPRSRSTASRPHTSSAPRCGAWRCRSSRTTSARTRTTRR